MAKLSFVIPVYGVENYLEQCVDSVINQTFEDIEIILVDDKSPDRCPEMCDRYSAQDDRIKVIHREQNGGLRAAVFTGLSNATGEYVTFVDSDDYVLNDYAQKLYDAITKNSADCATSGFIECFGDIKKEVYLQKSGVYSKEQIEKDVLQAFFEHGVEMNATINNNRCAKIYKTKLLKLAAKDCNEKLSMREDFELNLRFLPLCERVFVINDYVGYCYRIDREGSITNSFNKNRIEQNDILIEELKKLCVEQKRPGRYIKAMESADYFFELIDECLSSGISDTQKLEYIELVIQKISSQQLIENSAKEATLYLNSNLSLNRKLCLLDKISERIEKAEFITCEKKDKIFISLIFSVAASSLDRKKNLKKIKDIKRNLTKKCNILWFSNNQNLMGKISCLLVYLGFEWILIALYNLKR